MRHLLVGAWAVLAWAACAGPSAKEGGSTIDDLDAGSERDGSTRTDSGAPIDPDGALPPGTRLVVGSEAGYVLSLAFRTEDALASDPRVTDLGSELRAIAIRPGTRDLYAVTRSEEEERATIHRLRLESDGRFEAIESRTAAFTSISEISFDRSGAWALWAADGSFGAARIADDGFWGTATDLGSCDAAQLIASPSNSSLVGLCKGDTRARIFPFDVESGPSVSASEIPFDRVSPVHAVDLGEHLITLSVAENADYGVNNLALVAEDRATPLDQLSVRADWLEDVSRPYSTALSRHPSLPVVYTLHGESYQYGGFHLAVVEASTEGQLDVRQYVTVFRSSYALGVSPDGRWLLVGSHGVSEVRAHSIDPSTGELLAEKVVTLVDAPIFIEFL